ncbi:MAG: extracellular solute-binding protein, partial [Spirochaetes bacterium]|nr:extracellular solute-binding protein [Spirochaetota bacterium]
MKKIKKILTVSIAVIVLSLLVITVGGCGKGTKGPATLKVIWWGSQTRHEKTLKVIEMYQALNPDITIEPTYTSWDGYWEKLSTLAAGGEMPDVLSMTINNMAQYLEKNLIADMSNIGTIDKQAIDPASLDSGRMNGKLYGVCLGANAMALGYNKDLFDKAGIEYPNEKWTWDDLEKASNALFSKLGVWGIGNISDAEVDFFLRGKGESMYSKDAKDVGFTEKTAVEMMALINK